MSDAISHELLESICQFKFSEDIRTALRGKEDSVSVYVVQDKESEGIFKKYQDILAIPDWKERRKGLLPIRGQVAENSISLRKAQTKDVVKGEAGNYYLLYEYYDPKIGFDLETPPSSEQGRLSK